MYLQAIYNKPIRFLQQIGYIEHLNYIELNESGVFALIFRAKFYDLKKR